MYGMLLESIQHYLKELYGEETWNKIRELAGIHTHVFITHQRYSDDLFLKLAEGAAHVVGKDNGMGKNDFLKFFGSCFVKFFTHYGYDRVIRVTGRNLGDFLNSIDNIHEHMRFAYPKMDSPRFYCTEESSTGLTLHYLSKRKGLQFYVVGQIEEVVREFYPMEISIKILGKQLSSCATHVIYRLQFDNSDSKPLSPLASPCKRGPKMTVPLERFFHTFPFSLVISQNMCISMAGSCLLTTLGADVVGSRIEEVFTLRRPKLCFNWENLQRNRVIFELVSRIPVKKTCSPQLRHKISKSVITRKDVPTCKSYQLRRQSTDSYHGDLTVARKLNGSPINKRNGIKLDRNGVTQSDSKNEKDVTQGDTTKEHPIMNNNSTLTSDLRTTNYEKSQIINNKCIEDEIPNDKVTEGTERVPEKNYELHLRGEMKYISTWNKILFVCSPLISSLDEMTGLGLYMSDLGIHDRSQEMVLLGITPLPQLEYARDQLIDRSKKLEENLKKLDKERKLSDELLYRMIPKPIADRLKNGAKAIETCEYFENVTVLFSYLDGFITLCSNVDAMEVVALVNTMFIIFDELSEKHDVYKFETLGDAVYMAVSGAPVRKKRHAEPMAAMALAMIESMNKIKKDCGRDTLTITIGIHSGAAAAGLVGLKMPQYCLFGDTVNIASRLRNTSLPMRIQLSESCNKCLIGTEYKTEYRGEIPLKGIKIQMKTYWLIGYKDEVIRESSES